MFLTKRNRGILSTCLVCILVASIAMFALGYWVVNKNVTFTSKSVTCSLSGTYTREEHQSGTITWSPTKPSSATITVSGTASGIGRAAVEVKEGSINGTKVHGAKGGDRVGKWGTLLFPPLIPVYSNGTKSVNISSTAVSNLPLGENTYTWTGEGRYYTQGVRYTGYTWQDKPEYFTDGGGTGEWTIEHKKVCPECNKYVDSFTEHQITCPGCGSTYWSCSPTNELAQNQWNHRRRTHSGTETVYGNLPDGRSFGQQVSGCGATFYHCQGASTHRKNQCSACGYYYNRCEGHTCSAGNSQSPRGNSGTVSNGGNTGGTTGGTSADRVRCGHGRNGNACRYGGWASSREAHKTTCPAGHRYYACSASGASFHANCRARRSGEVRCARGSYCRSGGWASSRNAHQTTCRQGHTYWSCWPSAVSRHRRH